MACTRLLMVDGHAVAYRAFYAIRGLCTQQGKPTNAVFGFVKMLRKLAAIWEPTHWGVVFDGGLPEERRLLLPEYKAQRPPMPEELRGQMQECRRFLQCAGVAELTLEGQEADDALASIACQSRAVMDEILIATGDKDLYQIVDDRIRVIPVTGSGTETVGPEQVKARTGVRPEQVVDWLALTGDACDNIPGVPGIGPKTAARLIEEYGTLDGLLKSVDTVSRAKWREALAAGKELVLRNAAMVRLRTDIEIPVDWFRWERRSPNKIELAAFFDEMEFKSLAAAERQADLFA